MKQIEKQGITILESVEESLSEILLFVDQHKETLSQSHLIIVILGKTPEEISDLMSFLPLAQFYKEELRKSFVLVCDVISTEELEQLEEALNITPTLQEAHDLIEMEEIERDLGF